MADRPGAGKISEEAEDGLTAVPVRPGRQFKLITGWVRDFEQKNGHLPRACVVNMGYPDV